MRSVLVVLLLSVLVACAPTKPETVKPDSTQAAKPKPDVFMNLALSALIVLVLFPILMPKK